jgi:hypothetical protein
MLSMTTSIIMALLYTFLPTRHTPVGGRAL